MMNTKLTLQKELSNGTIETLCDIPEFSYTASRMGDAPSITATINRDEVRFVDNSCFVTFNGDRFYIQYTPDTTKSNDDARYKYNATFYSPRIILNNILFFDVTSTAGQLASKSSDFKFSGTIIDLVDKLNLAIRFAGLDDKFEIVINDASKYAADEAKLITFQNSTVNEAIQQIFKSFEEEYYVERENGKDVFHVGSQDSSNIATVLEYGADKSLLRITKRSKTNKIINRITGVGSSENIPYFYPNESPTGHHIVLSNTITKDGANINYEMLSAKTDLGEGCTLSYWKQLKGRDVMTFNFRHIGSNAVEATKATDSNYYTTERLAQDIVQNFTDGGDDYMYSAEFSIELGDAENGRYLCAIKPFVDASYRKSYRRSSTSSSTTGGTSASRPNGTTTSSSRGSGTSSSRTSSGYSSSRSSSSSSRTGSSSGRTSGTTSQRPSSTATYEDVDFDKVEIYVVGVFPNTESTTVVDYTVSDDGTISFDSGIGRVLKFKVRAKKSDMGEIKQLWMDVSYIDNSDDFTKDDNFIDIATNKLIKASESGISLVGEATSGGVLTISKTLTSIPHQDKLMPSIYRGTYGNERFYEAVNSEVTIEGEISSELSGYEENKYKFSYSFDGHEFDNPFVAGNRCEHIVEFDHIKPTIKGAKYLGSPIDVFEDFDYDVNDNDELDEKNTLKHSFFYAKLKPLGFNLFASASEQGNMTISFTNGDCAACVFEIVVDKESNKNVLLTKNVNGSYVVDKGEDGKAKFAATASETQAHQNDTTNTSVWIALRKDNKTFNETFPNSKTGMLPTTSDNFVITNINLPLIYITEAEERLEEAIKQYLIDNNSEHFNYDIKFSRIFLANHIEDVFDKLNENSSLYARLYPNDDAQLLYVSSYTYTMRSGESLPEVSITLDDNVTTSTTPKQAMISSITSEVMFNVARMNILAQGSKYFLRKDQSDVTEHTITANEIVVKNNSKVEGDSFVRGGVEVDKNVVVKQNLFVDQYSKFGDIAQFSNEAIFGTFSDTIGTITGAKISPEGNAAFNSIKANYFDVYTLRYNEIRGSSAFTYFDDTATIVEIAPILNSDGTKKTPEQFTLWLDAGDDTYLHPFKNYDILYGYVNAIGDGGNTAVGGQCWMRVISMRDGTYSIDVEMYPDDDCPAGKNILPTANMTFAHRGNCYPSSGPDSEQYIGRKNTFFISAKDGHVVQLLDVTHPKLYTLTDESNPNNYSNYGVVMGKLPPDLLAYVNKYHSFVHKDDPVLYAKYVAVQNFLQLDYAGRPIKTERYRGAWSQDNANGSDKYRAESAQDVTYYDTVAYDGSKWQCVVDKTTRAPKEGESDWAIIVRKGDSATPVYAADLSNQFDSVGTDKDGNADSPYTIETVVSLFKGTEKVEIKELTATKPHDNIGVNVEVVDGKFTGKITYSVAQGKFISERNYSEITVKHDGMDDKKFTFTIAGVRAGDDGAPATIYRLIPSATQIVKNKDGEYEPTEITFTGSYKLTGGVLGNINDYKINCYLGEDWDTSGTVGNVNLKVKDKKITQPITVYLYDENGEVADVETIAFVEDGDKGNDGKNGLSPNPNLMLNSNLNLVVNRQVTDSMISNYYGEKWVRITRKANSNHYAMIKDNRARFEPYQDIVGLDWCLLYDYASGYFKLCNRALGPSKALKARSVGSGQGFDFASIAEGTLFGHSETNDGYIYFYVKGNQNLGLNSWGGGSQGDLALYGGGINDTGNQWFVNTVSVDRQKFLYWDYVHGDITQNGGFNQIGNNYTGIAMKTSLFAASGVTYTLSMSLISFATNVIIDFTSPDYSGGLTIECKHPRATVNGTVVTVASTNEQTEIAITLKHSLQVQQIPLLIYTSHDGGATISQMKWEIGSEATPYRLADSDLASPRVSTVYKRSDGRPATPDNESGSYEEPIPAGWSAALPSETNVLAVYSTTNTFYMGGFSTGWSEPQLLVDSTGFEVIYSPSLTKPNIPPVFTGLDSWFDKAEVKDVWYDDYTNIDPVWMATTSRDAGSTTWSNWVVTRVKGEAGESVVFADLTNEMDSFALTNDGKVAIEGDISTTVSLWKGAEHLEITGIKVCGSEKFSGIGDWSSGNVAKASDGLSYTINITVLKGEEAPEHTAIPIEVFYGDLSRTLIFTLNGVKAGSDGSPAKLYKLKPSNTQVIHKKDGTYEPTRVSCSAILIVDGKEQAVTDSNIKLRYYANGSTSPTSYNSGSNISSSTFKQVKFELVDISGTTVLNTTKVLDVETISVLEEGKDGNNGEDGSAPAWNLLNNSAFKYDEEREIEFWEIDDDIDVVISGEYNSLESRYTGTGQINTYVNAARQRVTNTLINNKWYVLSVYCSKTTSSIGSASVSFGNSVYRELYLNGTKVIKGDNGSVTLANGYNEIVFQYGYDFGVDQDEYISFTLPYGTDKVFSIRQPKVEAITVDNPSLAKATAWMPSILDMSGGDGNSPQENLVLNSNFDMYESNEFDFTTVSNSFDSIMSRTYGECWVRLKRYSKPEHYLYINSTENDTIPYYGPNPTSIDASLWCFVGTTSSFKIYNKYAGPSKAFRVERDGPDYPWWFAEVCDASDAGSWKFGSTANGAIAICSTGGGDTYINSYAGHENGGLSALYSLDDGSRWKVDVLVYRGLKFWEREDGYVVENSYDGFNSYALTATTGHTGISQITPNLELNTWYTLSFRFRSFNVSSAILDVILEHAFADSDVVTSSEESPIFGEQTTEFGFGALDSVWKTASVSFKLTSSPTKFYYTLCCTMSGGGAVYITQPKLERGKKATPYRKAETDLAGPAGETGPMLVPQGTWDAGVTYKSSITTKPFVYYEGSYYVLEVAESTGQNPDDNIGSIWKKMDEIEYLFTKFLLANQARFGNNDGGIFYNNWLFSARLKNGKSYGDSGYNNAIDENGAIGDTKPMLALDFKEGKLIAEKAQISGTVYATSGKFTGEVEATGGYFKNGELNCEHTSYGEMWAFRRNGSGHIMYNRLKWDTNGDFHLKGFLNPAWLNVAACLNFEREHYLDPVIRYESLASAYLITPGGPSGSHFDLTIRPKDDNGTMPTLQTKAITLLAPSPRLSKMLHGTLGDTTKSNYWYQSNTPRELHFFWDGGSNSTYSCMALVVPASNNPFMIYVEEPFLSYTVGSTYAPSGGTYLRPKMNRVGVLYARENKWYLSNRDWVNVTTL